MLDWINQREVASGGLVEVLKDWEATEAVQVNVLYSPSVRRMPIVRAFIDFVSEPFRQIDAARAVTVVGTDRPAWMRHTGGRASDLVRVTRQRPDPCTAIECRGPVHRLRRRLRNEELPG